MVGPVGLGVHRPLQIVASPRNTAVHLTLCDQLILRKFSKLDAARCQILELKCTKFDFRWDCAPDPVRGAYSAPPGSVAVFKRKGRERARRDPAPQLFWPRTVPDLIPYAERKCADTIGTVLGPWASHFRR